MISIIMPFKNESKHLVATLESIVSQTYKNFELIAVDDNSSDNSLEIIKSFSDSRIKILKNEGNGIIAALKTAEKMVSGEYITRQDADDLMPKDKLQNLLSILLESGKGCIATGKIKYFSDKELGNGFIKYEKWINKLCDNNSFYDHIFKECVLVSSNFMIHIDDFKILKGFSDSVYPEDYHFCFKAYTKGLKVISSKEITHLWRDHENRASRNLEQYKDQKFFKLKLLFLLKVYPKKQFVIWGAGPSGKKLAKEFQAANISFGWITDNLNKINKNIYDVQIKSPETLKIMKDHIVLISVTQRNALEGITRFLNSIDHKLYMVV